MTSKIKAFLCISCLLLSADVLAEKQTLEAHLLAYDRATNLRTQDDEAAAELHWQIIDLVEKDKSLIGPLLEWQSRNKFEGMDILHGLFNQDPSAIASVADIGSPQANALILEYYSSAINIDTSLSEQRREQMIEEALLIYTVFISELNMLPSDLFEEAGLNIGSIFLHVASRGSAYFEKQHSNKLEFIFRALQKSFEEVTHLPPQKNAAIVMAIAGNIQALGGLPNFTARCRQQIAKIRGYASRSSYDKKLQDKLTKYWSNPIKVDKLSEAELLIDQIIEFRRIGGTLPMPNHFPLIVSALAPLDPDDVLRLVKLLTDELSKTEVAYLLSAMSHHKNPDLLQITLKIPKCSNIFGGGI